MSEGAVYQSQCAATLTRDGALAGEISENTCLCLCVHEPVKWSLVADREGNWNKPKTRLVGCINEMNSKRRITAQSFLYSCN